MIVYDLQNTLPVSAVRLNLLIGEKKNQLSIYFYLLKNVALHLPLRIMELSIVFFKSMQYFSAECWDVARVWVISASLAETVETECLLGCGHRASLL